MFSYFFDICRKGGRAALLDKHVSYVKNIAGN
jgi:hypothetical protein